MSLRRLTAIAATALATQAHAADQALVIGVDSYPELGLDGVLTSAVSDAGRVATFLQEEAGFAADQVTLLTGADATSEAILNALVDRLVGLTAPGDRVVFYFAGLGSRIVARTGDEPDGLDEVILAYDAGTILGKIPERAISEILDIISDRDVTVIVDASFGGGTGFGATTGFGSIPRDISLLDDGSGQANEVSARPTETGQDSFSEAPFGSGKAERKVWNAAAPAQFAWETAEGGVFTSLLLQGLRTSAADSNGNGVISNAEMTAYLRQETEAWCVQDFGCAGSEAGLAPGFDGPLNAPVLAAKRAPEQEPQTDLPPILADTGGPINYEQTIGLVTDLFGPSNAANLELGIRGSNPLKIGETVAFTATSDAAGTLILFDVNPMGELVQIFPSALAPDDAMQISEGRTQFVPNGLSSNGKPLQIRVSEPAGRGFLLGILVEDDLPRLKQMLPENLSLGPVPNAGQYLYEIAQELLKLQVSGEGNSAVRWSAVHLPYEITR